MTRDAHHRRSVDIQDLSDVEILAGLWEKAAFPRLPCDAPAALEDLVEEVENPRRVYTIHRASRRHHFQLLVQKFIVQLRDGCGSSSCDTPSCFSCRKRIIPRWTPVRRYNTTSARTIAVYLASQDNPESALCPSLRSPKTPPAALSSLVFTAKPARQVHSRAPQNGHVHGPSSKGKSSGATSPTAGPPRGDSRRHSGHGQDATVSRDGDRGPSSHTSESSGKALGPAGFTLTERPVSKDHRSFTANVFGTVAFKMLEWLTPASLDDMSRRASEFDGRHAVKAMATTGRPTSPDADEPSTREPPGEEGGDCSPGRTKVPTEGDPSSKPVPFLPPSSNSPVSPTLHAMERSGPETENDATDANGEKTAAKHPTSLGSFGTASQRPGYGRRNSNARVRTSSSAKPKRNVSMDGFSAEQAAAADELLSTLKSPRLSGLPPQEKSSKTALKSVPAAITRPISQLSNAGFFDDVSLEKMPPPNHTNYDSDPSSTPKVNASSGGRSKPPGGAPPNEGSHSQAMDSGVASACSPAASSSPERTQISGSPCDSDAGPGPDYRGFLPQTVGRLNPELIDFFCDVLQDDCTVETHMFVPEVVERLHHVRGAISHVQCLPNRRSGRFGGKPLERTCDTLPSPYPVHMMYRWMMFIEQSFFYVLSDPRRLIRSFSKKGQLFDSQTLWYCMLRMSRVAPTVVMHSLWQAAGALFAPPDGVVRSLPAAAAARLFPSLRRRGVGAPAAVDHPLSNLEAGLLLSICLHLLIAIAPVASSKDELLEMSRLRSRGLVLTRGASEEGTGTSSVSLCLAYNDAFSNDLAMRLARRLFAAIPTRQYLDQLSAPDGVLDASSAGAAAAAAAAEDSEDDVSVGVVEEPPTPDVLSPIFQQLDFLNVDTMYMLHFSIPLRAVHEIRAPTLLLDWARNVMLQDWDGRPEVPSDGPFGGALALIKAMYQKRRLLVLADGHFLADYFAERLDEVEVPVSWMSFTPTRRRLHLLDFPYLFPPSTLVSFFRSINFARMARAYEEASSVQERMSAIAPPRGSLIVNPHHRHVLQDMLRTASSKYLVLSVGRERVLEDAFDQLWRREERELARPLKVRIGERSGEEGFDSGGVQQEFFRLAVAAALDPDFGAFTVDERTRMTWFNPASPEPDWKFELVGLIFSLAVYNGLTLPVTFPEALYRKLLGEPVTELHHVSDGWPDLASGLTALLDWDEKDGAVEDVFARTYEFSISAFGEAVSREMRPPRRAGGGGEEEAWPAFPGKRSFGGTSYPSSSAGAEPLHEGNPEDAPLVTRENRDAYVADYIRYLTDVSVRPQYEAFARGFRTCLGHKPLTLLTPKLLQSLVEGVQEIDVAELRRHARYVGWDASHRSVRDFWAVVRRFDDAMLRRLLEFVTASDRVPVGGIKNMQFVVQRNGEEEGTAGHLPTAYTCYGTLLLPEYRDREVLRERLCMALENAQGFGFA